MMAQKRKRLTDNPPTDQMVTYHHYPTSSNFVRHALRYLVQLQPLFFQRAEWERPLRILDHSCGTGVWNAVAAELWPDSYRVNVEYQLAEPIRPETAQEWHFGQRFQDWARAYSGPRFDLVIGNGPFKELEEFFHIGYNLLTWGGLMWNLAPVNFLGTQERTQTLWNVLTPLYVVHSPKRLSFTKDGKTDEKEYVMILHQHGTIPQCAYEDWRFRWSEDQPEIPEDQVFCGQGAPELQASFTEVWS